MPGEPVGVVLDGGVGDGDVMLLIVVVFLSPLPCVILTPKLDARTETVSTKMELAAPLTDCWMVRLETRAVPPGAEAPGAPMTLMLSLLPVPEPSVPWAR